MVGHLSASDIAHWAANPNTDNNSDNNATSNNRGDKIMNIMNAFESLYQYLFSVKAYTKETIAGYVGKTVDAGAYKRITGDDYVAPSA